MGEKIQYECVVEIGDEGPVFSVTPMRSDGQLLVEKRRQVCICFICVPVCCYRKRQGAALAAR